MTPRHEAPFLVIAASQPPPDIPRQVEFGLAHRFQAASYDYPGVTRLDFERGENDAVNTRATAPVKGYGGNRIRPTRSQDREPGGIGAFSVLVGLAHNDFFHLDGLNAGPLDGLIEDQSSEFIDRDRFHASSEGANRRAHPGKDYYFFHFIGLLGAGENRAGEWVNG
jgi:hypothetical protein